MPSVELIVALGVPPPLQEGVAAAELGSISASFSNARAAHQLALLAAVEQTLVARSCSLRDAAAAPAKVAAIHSARATVMSRLPLRVLLPRRRIRRHDGHPNLSNFLFPTRPRKRGAGKMCRFVAGKVIMY